MAQRLARLDAGRNLELDPVAVDAGNGDGAAKRSAGEADRRLGDQGRAFAAKIACRFIWTNK